MMSVDLNQLVFEDVSQTIDEKTITIHFRINQNRYKLILFRASDTNRAIPVYVHHNEDTTCCPQCHSGNLQLCVDLSAKVWDVFRKVTQANSIRLYWVTHSI